MGWGWGLGKVGGWGGGWLTYYYFYSYRNRTQDIHSTGKIMPICYIEISLWLESGRLGGLIFNFFNF